MTDSAHPEPHAFPFPVVFALAVAGFGALAVDLSPANAASAATAAASDVLNRQEFTSKHAVPTQFTLARDHAPIASGTRFETRFAGQDDAHDCTIALPKAGQLVRPGETATGTIQCSSHWAIQGDALRYDVFEGGRPAGQGTLRP